MHMSTIRRGGVRALLSPLMAFCRWFGARHPETLVRIRYCVRFRRLLNLKNPQDLNEKILWLAFRTDTTRWTELSDKNDVRDYVAKAGLSRILSARYGVWDRIEDVDLSALPDSFVLKTTHGSGDVWIVRDKSKLDFSAVKTYFGRLLKEPYGALEGGKHYLRMKPRLIAEELLIQDAESKRYSSSIIDYKFWCFNGKPRYCLVCSNRDKDGTDLLTYDSDWNPHPEYSVVDREHRLGKVMPKPKNYAEMLRICERLADGFPCVRVDLYNLDGMIRFGELTFTSLGGMMNYYTPDFLLEAGRQIELPIEH